MEENDLCDLMMQGHNLTHMINVTVDPSVDIQHLVSLLDDPGQLLTWRFPERSDISVPEFDKIQQKHWFLPADYQQLDIAQHVLSLCHTEQQLQRAGQELLMFQERDLFDLLRYLRYLVDVMKQHNVIWGVGRGSSVASYVLYLLEVHRIDSLYYDLDPTEFLR